MSLKIKEKIKSRRGMSLGEMLCAVLILLLASGGMAAGVQLAVQEYNKSVRDSEADILYSTLSNIITNELSKTDTVVVNKSCDSEGYCEVVDFQATNYGKTTYSSSIKTRTFISVDESGARVDGYGKIYYGMKNNNTDDRQSVLGKKAYSSDLSAWVYKISYNNSTKCFKVDLRIGLNDELYEKQTFNVFNDYGTDAETRS